MGRASRDEAARTRARIVEKAADLFRGSGVEAVSVVDVMGALGLTVGGFYRHFASKDALVAEAVALAFEQADASWAGVVAARPDARAALAEHYLRDRPDRRGCPMIAFAPYLAAGGGAPDARAAYADGAEVLARRYAGADRPAAADKDALVRFAAMVGARLLSEVDADGGWSRAVREAVEDVAGGADRG